MPGGQTDRSFFLDRIPADLKPIDLFPILSWCLTRGKCRYCSGPIPSIYTAIEIACGAAFIAYFLYFGLSESFLLYATFAVFAIILAAIERQQGWLAATIYSYAWLCLALARTLAEGTIYGIVKSGFVMLVLALLALRLSGKQSKPFEQSWVWWLVLLGSALPFAQWGSILPVAVGTMLLPKEARLLMFILTALLAPLLA